MTGVLVVLVALALAGLLGWWWQRRDGRLRAVGAAPDATHPAGSAALAAVGVPAGAVTLVQFSAPVCAPCRATRRVLAEVRANLPGVHLVEVDVEEHLDAARALDVWRTPTVLVVDAAGRVVQRAAGVPAPDDLRAALAPLLAEAQR
ncbi:thioredoxin family protein [Micromonospora soli]|uniref:TlpA family protein disulfide reductase n=1 Tax=Micromonospora sp. NBRC 110009 TaxID=3061627 RepID=UPI002671FE4B|nr:thioredoxin family protein [Micromonospora sp. NBRC 110009]WKT97771.1 thioredoxin family protein [Micromonospora sp. NBRC 110009]